MKCYYAQGTDEETGAQVNTGPFSRIMHLVSGEIHVWLDLFMPFSWLSCKLGILLGQFRKKKIPTLNVTSY